MQLSERTLPLARALRFAQQIVPIRGWDRVMRATFDPSAQKPFRFEIPLFEATFVGNAENFIDWYALLHGCYEGADIRVMRTILSQIDEAIVLDIGANVGHHALALASLTREVHAFEPYPPRINSLRVNIERNPHLVIRLHPIALGNEDGTGSFRHTFGGEWAGVQYDREGLLRFPIRHAGRYLHEHEIDRIDLVKLDVDGNEKDILQALADTIRDCRPIVVVEADGGIAEYGNMDWLPERYRLFGNVRGRVLDRYVFCEVTPQFVGNVFCMPEERRHLLTYIRRSSALGAHQRPV